MGRFGGKPMAGIRKSGQQSSVYRNVALKKPENVGFSVIGADLRAREQRGSWRRRCTDVFAELPPGFSVYMSVGGFMAEVDQVDQVDGQEDHCQGQAQSPKPKAPFKECYMMNRTLMPAIVVAAAVLAAGAFAAEPALTIYNQDFAVVRDSVPLDLKQGVNRVSFNDMTAHVEPDSVMLRDPAGVQALQILEQNYRSDPISQELLLNLYEGKMINFQVTRGEKQEIVRGKIVRSGYVPHQAGLRRYGQQYRQTQYSYSSGGGNQPIIEMEGKLRFGLPGVPIFPALGDDTILKPTMDWLIAADKPGKFDAELCYVTGGMSWEADYNVVAPEQGDVVDVIGWVTMDNQSGRAFENARIKLMAGDVNKIQPEEAGWMWEAGMGSMGGAMPEPPVSERTFDELHLYTLQRPTTLRDRETKQVEFVRAANVTASRFYIYDGAKIDWQRYRGWSMENVRQQSDYGTQCNPKVWVMREFENAEANGLGLPLPKGRMRFYRRGDAGQLEFIGESMVDHTPRDEKISVYTGNAFDLVGERRRTNFKLNEDRGMLDESFEIKVRNHKKEEAEIRVVEHLYRWHTWEITITSHKFTKTDSQTIEYRVKVAPNAEQTITYTVHYTW